jgi:diguanylate cyclase (GGDEF)-like protein
VSPNRLAKQIVRRLTVSWREQPTQRDIEALGDNMRRVGMVIRFRWVTVAALTLFSLTAVAFYSLEPAIPDEVLTANMIVPALALIFVLGYNTFYQLTYRRLGNIAFLNHAQLLFDILVVSVLVHYSGGVYSWFDAMYALIVLEAAFIFPRSRDTWIVAGWAMLSYGAVLGLEYARVVPHAAMPLISGALFASPAYVLVRYAWTVTVVVGTSVLSQLMMSILRGRETELAHEAGIDQTTGLHDRRHFQDRLTVELQRARCYDRGLAVLVVDIDNFGAFNNMFGIEAGNDMLRAVAGRLVEQVRDCTDSPVSELNTVCRFGGEEFAIVMPEPPAAWGGDADAGATVRLIGERVRIAVGDLRVSDMGVTVSVGVACFPADGRTSGDLLASADRALFAALAAGGNRVVSAADAAGDGAEARSAGAAAGGVPE